MIPSHVWPGRPCQHWHWQRHENEKRAPSDGLLQLGRTSWHARAALCQWHCHWYYDHCNNDITGSVNIPLALASDRDVQHGELERWSTDFKLPVAVPVLPSP